MKFNTKYRSRIIRGLKKKRKKYQKFPRVITINLSSINRILALHYGIFFLQKKKNDDSFTRESHFSDISLPTLNRHAEM